MTIRPVSSPSAAGGGTLSRLTGPDGLPAAPTAPENILLPTLAPATVVSMGGEPDVLFVADTRDELTVLADGGMLGGNSNTALAPGTPKATLADGLFRRSVQSGGGEASACWPIDGCLPLDQFTIVCYVNPGAAALDTINTTIWRYQSGVQTLTLRNTGTSLIAELVVDERNFLPAGANNVITATCAMTAGDVPANVFTAITVRWNATTGLLRVMIGNNARSGQSTATPNPTWLKRPWSGDPRATGFLVLGTDRLGGATATGIKVSDFIAFRYDREYGTNNYRTRPAPALTIDAATAQGAWRKRLAGVVLHYTGWARNETDEVAFAAQRDRQLDLLQAAGCPTVRIAEFHERAVPTLNTTSAPGSVTSIDFTGLNAHWDRAASRGFKVHCHVGYTPVAFGGGSTGATPPNISGFTETQAFALYAEYVSQVFAHIKQRYGTSLIESISFWNEPSLGGFWTGSTAQLVALYEVVKTRMDADHPDLVRLGGPDEIFVAASWSSTASLNHKGIIDANAAAGRQQPNANLHAYTSQRTLDAVQRVDDMRRYLDSKGFTSTDVQITEWGDISGAYLANGQANILSQDHRTQNEHIVGFIHAFFHDVYEAGARAGYFFRLGQQGTGNSSATGEIQMGLIAPDGRPWPAFSAFALHWKHAGNRVAATSNWPGWRALASKAASGVITVTYGSYRPYRRSERRTVRLNWTGLPTTFTWKQWRVDQTTLHDSRPHLIAQGDQTNLPAGAELTGCGMGCIQITPA
jgi:hypothetical protein